MLAGCAGTNFEWSNARQLKTGMTQAEVTALMGRPYLVKSEGAGRVKWVWSWAAGFGGHKAMSVAFQDGALVEVPEIPAEF